MKTIIIGFVIVALLVLVGSTAALAQSALLDFNFTEPPMHAKSYSQPPPAENLQTIRVEVDHCNSGVAPFCFEYVVQNNDTVWGIARFLRAPGERTVDMKNRIVAIERNRAQFEKVSPRLKKISNEPGHWIFPGQKIMIPVVSLVEKQAVEAAAKKAAKEAAEKLAVDARAREAEFALNALKISITVVVFAVVFMLIAIHRKAKRYSAPRTPEERAAMINDPNWKMGEPSEPKDPDRNKIKPSTWDDWMPKMLLIGFTFFASASDVHAGEITNLNDPENPLLIVLIILVAVRYLFPLLLFPSLNFLSRVLSSKTENHDKELSRNSRPIRTINDSITHRPKAKVIPLFQNEPRHK
ncbi:MAG: LysM peptidoglycan-binding domain-containing protein [Candidatus Sungbacteria bacterium]|nr:LysM peptidoglycan-binding domain-containing protein [Candidatus Sungbacteria bacterium]